MTGLRVQAESLGAKKGSTAPSYSQPDDMKLQNTFIRRVIHVVIELGREKTEKYIGKKRRRRKMYEFDSFF